MPAAPWEWMNPVVSERVTGRKTFRRQKWTGKIILRVEIEETRRGMFYTDTDDSTHDIIRFIWRDASFTDAINLMVWESDNKKEE